MQIKCKNCGLNPYRNVSDVLWLIDSLTKLVKKKNQELEWQKQQYQIICKQARMVGYADLYTPAWHNPEQIEVEVMKIVMTEQEADKGIPAELEDK